MAAAFTVSVHLPELPPVMAMLFTVTVSVYGPPATSVGAL